MAMQGFTQKIVQMMKAERLFESQGGPIILSQVSLFPNCFNFYFKFQKTALCVERDVGLIGFIFGVIQKLIAIIRPFYLAILGMMSTSFFFFIVFFLILAD